MINLQQLTSTLFSIGFRKIIKNNTSCIFKNFKTETCIIIDIDICKPNGLQYIDYTTSQNNLVDQDSKLFRFLLSDYKSIKELSEEIQIYLSGDKQIEILKRFGRDRTESDIDPTPPEAAFEDLFIDAFGEESRDALHREFEYFDFGGKRRFIDYALFTKTGNFAIELNGERYHHPQIIGSKKYSSQLWKQNSLTADGFKIFRWSLRGMQDIEKFISDIKNFFCSPSLFLHRSALKFERSIETFQLHEHQDDSLQYIEKLRKEGRNTFLIVLPTGTGKTEIFLEDFRRLKEKSPKIKGLIIVPTRVLRQQTLDRLKQRLPHLKYSENFIEKQNQDICVQTNAFLTQNYYKVEKNKFDYIVVDEAHHGVATGLRKTLEYFCPKNLIGVTASPDRLDKLRLEEIFGEYEPMLSLEEAIKEGLVPPIRSFRIKSNIDLSEVRFNGKEYVKSDLQKTLLVISRDQIIVDTLIQYFDGTFSNKQGVIFCVDIKHAKRMASLLSEHGITAMAVSGSDRKKSDQAKELYKQEEIRFLCACDLLSEGWDSPQTSILVMARPTFSKVLYTQQLGRGTRKYPGKEALYVLDVVDSYGAALQPMSLHAFFGVDGYIPFGDIIKTNKGSEDEIIILDGLYEGIREIEPVNIFSFEKLYGDMLNEERLSRELFVSTGTVKSWIKKGDITPDAQFPFGRSKLSFFKPEQIDNIRKQKGLKEHTKETRKADFLEFLEKRDYTFSYKIIFLLSFLKVVNQRGEADLPMVLENYQFFYQQLYQKHNKNEKDNNPYNNTDFLNDESKLQRNMLQNPFEKFERKRFFYHCKDLNYIAVDNILWLQITSEDKKRIIQQMVKDLEDYYNKQEITISNDDYRFLLSDQDTLKPEINLEDYLSEEKKYTTHLPYYPLSIAAGEFLSSETPLEPDGWIDVLKSSERRILNQNMFVSQVTGKSMEPLIPEGSYCIFTRQVGGTREGKIVLVQMIGLGDNDTGANFTLKKYHSIKKQNVDTEWTHEKITLIPSNPDYSNIDIDPDEAEKFSIIAFLVEVLKV